MPFAFSGQVAALLPVGGKAFPVFFFYCSAGFFVPRSAAPSSTLNAWRTAPPPQPQPQPQRGNKSFAPSSSLHPPASKHLQLPQRKKPSPPRHLNHHRPSNPISTSAYPSFFDSQQIPHPHLLYFFTRPCPLSAPSPPCSRPPHHHFAPPKNALPRLPTCSRIYCFWRLDTTETHSIERTRYDQRRASYLVTLGHNHPANHLRLVTWPPACPPLLASTKPCDPLLVVNDSRWLARVYILSRWITYGLAEQSKPFACAPLPTDVVSCRRSYLPCTSLARASYLSRHRRTGLPVA